MSDEVNDFEENDVLLDQMKSFLFVVVGAFATGTILVSNVWWFWAVPIVLGLYAIASWSKGSTVDESESEPEDDRDICDDCGRVIAADATRCETCSTVGQWRK